MAADIAGDRTSKFDVDRYGFLEFKYALFGTLQRAVLKRLRAQVLCLAPYPRLEGHLTGTSMYYNLRREYDGTHMATDAN